MEQKLSQELLGVFLEAKEGISLPRAAIKKGKSANKKPTKTQTATAKWAHAGICMENKSGLQWSYKETTGQGVYILQIAATATEPPHPLLPVPSPPHDLSGTAAGEAVILTMFANGDGAASDHVSPTWKNLPDASSSICSLAQPQSCSFHGTAEFKRQFFFSQHTHTLFLSRSFSQTQKHTHNTHKPLEVERVASWWRRARDVGLVGKLTVEYLREKNKKESKRRKPERIEERKGEMEKIDYTPFAQLAKKNRWNNKKLFTQWQILFQDKAVAGALCTYAEMLGRNRRQHTEPSCRA